MQEDEKEYKFELIYANAALEYIEEIHDIDLLEKHAHSRIRNIKDSPIYTIDNIKKRLDGEPPVAK